VREPIEFGEAPPGHADGAPAVPVSSGDTEEIDALTTMALDPTQFLVTPKFLAMLVMMPCLTTWADTMGVFGGALFGAPSVNSHGSAAAGEHQRNAPPQRSRPDHRDGAVPDVLESVRVRTSHTYMLSGGCVPTSVAIRQRWAGCCRR